MTEDEFNKRFYAMNSEYELVGRFTGFREPIEVRCKKCGKVQNRKAYLLLGSSKCAMCRERTAGMPRLTHEEFLDELKYIDSDYVPAEPYVKMLVPIKFVCKKCGAEFFKKPKCVVNSPKCIYCHKRTYIKHSR